MSAGSDFPPERQITLTTLPAEQGSVRPVTAFPEQTVHDPGVQLLGSLRAALWPILGATVLAGGAAFLLANAQPRVYEATSSMVASGAGESGVLSDSLISASTLPSGALNQALRSPSVIAQIIKEVGASNLPTAQRTTLTNNLKQQLAGGGFATLGISSSTDNGQNSGLYLLSARADTPVAAQSLADAGVNALLNWDTQRSQRRLERARVSIQGQLKALEKDTPNTDLYDDAHQQARARLLVDLGLTGALRQSATGTLDRLAEAVAPASPVSPRPLRSGLLSAVLAFLAASGVAALLGSRRSSPALIGD